MVSGQGILVALAVLAAVAYLLYAMRQFLASARGSGCQPGCGGGCPPAKQKPASGSGGEGSSAGLPDRFEV